MLFDIDADEGRAIRGWIVPDNPAAASKLRLLVPGRPEITIEANLYRADLHERGLHPTGRAGFEIDRSVVADLGDLDEVSLVEAETRLLLFRRAHYRYANSKLCIFDASIMPKNNILEHLSDHFANFYFHSERLSFETMSGIIAKPSLKSVVFYGRCAFKPQALRLAEHGFLSAALLQDPFLELAERLLILKLMANRRLERPEMISGLDLGLHFAQDLRLSDETAMLQAFRRLDPQQRELFANPMTRLFGCEADETPRRRHVSVALENLAAMDVVGVRSEFPLFQRMLAAVVGVEAVGAESPVILNVVAELAQKLSRIGVVEDMLAADHQLYELVRSSMRSAEDSERTGLRRDTQSI